MIAEIIKYWTTELNVLIGSEDRATRARALFELGAAYCNANEPQKALQHLQEARSICSEHQLNEMHAPILYYLADAHLALSQFQTAEGYYNECLDQSSDSGNDQFSCLSHLGLGITLWHQEKFTESVSSMVECAEFGLKGGYNYLVLEVIRSIRSLINENLLTETTAFLNQHIQACKEMKYRRAEALYLYGLGMAHHLNGEHQCALEHMESSAKIARKTSAEIIEALAMVSIGEMYYDHAEPSKSIECLNRALSIFDRLQYTPGKMNACELLFSNYKRKGNINKCLKYSDEMLKLAPSLLGKEIQALQIAGDLQLQMGNKNKSLELMNRCLEKANEDDHPRMICRASAYLGDIWLQTGDVRKALAYFDQCLTVSKESGFYDQAAITLNSLGGCYLYLSDYKAAAFYFSEALRVSQETGQIEGEVISRLNLIILAGDDWDPVEITDQISTCLQICQKHDLQRIAIVCLNILASACLKRNMLREAKTHIDHCLKLSLETNFIIGERNAYEKMGDVLEKQGDIREAIRYRLRALKISRRCKDHNNTILIRNELVTNYRQLGQNKKALAQAETAVREAEKSRTTIDFSSQRVSFAAGCAGLYDNLVALLFEAGNINRAYYISECNRARSFYESKLIREAGIPLPAVTPSQSLWNSSDFNSKLSRKTYPMRRGHRWTLKSMIRSIKGKNNELGHHSKPVEEPDQLLSMAFDPMTVEQVQSFLDKSTAILQFHVNEKQIFSWFITKKQIRSAHMAGVALDLDKTLNELHDTLRLQGSIEHFTRQLYDLLIEPFKDKLTTPNLVIVPHRVLHHLPFEMLRDEDGAILGDHWNLSYLTSGSEIKFALQVEMRKPRAIAGFGNPNSIHMESLPALENEIQTVVKEFAASEIFLGKDATIKNFKEFAPKADCLHIACHTISNLEEPWRSGLCLNAGDDGDGLLTISEISDLQLQADIVVISGCQTAVGKLREGDELIDLARAFQRAGARSVVASLWRVDDESTAYLMGQFYGHIGTHSRSEALRLAKIAMRAKYPHPFHWAPFILIGDSR